MGCGGHGRDWLSTLGGGGVQEWVWSFKKSSSCRVVSPSQSGCSTRRSSSSDSRRRRQRSRRRRRHVPKFEAAAEETPGAGWCLCLMLFFWEGGGRGEGLLSNSAE